MNLIGGTLTVGALALLTVGLILLLRSPKPSTPVQAPEPKRIATPSAAPASGSMGTLARQGTPQPIPRAPATPQLNAMEPATTIAVTEPQQAVSSSADPASDFHPLKPLPALSLPSSDVESISNNPVCAGEVQFKLSQTVGVVMWTSWMEKSARGSFLDSYVRAMWDPERARPAISNLAHQQLEYYAGLNSEYGLDLTKLRVPCYKLDLLYMYVGDMDNHVTFPLLGTLFEENEHGCLLDADILVDLDILSSDPEDTRLLPLIILAGEKIQKHITVAVTEDGPSASVHMCKAHSQPEGDAELPRGIQASIESIAASDPHFYYTSQIITEHQDTFLAMLDTGGCEAWGLASRLKSCSCNFENSKEFSYVDGSCYKGSCVPHELTIGKTRIQLEQFIVAKDAESDLKVEGNLGLGPECEIYSKFSQIGFAYEQPGFIYGGVIDLNKKRFTERCTDGTAVVKFPATRKARGILEWISPIKLVFELNGRVTELVSAGFALWDTGWPNPTLQKPLKETLQQLMSKVDCRLTQGILKILSPLGGGMSIELNRMSTGYSNCLDRFDTFDRFASGAQLSAVDISIGAILLHHLYVVFDKDDMEIQVCQARGHEFVNVFSDAAEPPANAPFTLSLSPTAGHMLMIKDVTAHGSAEGVQEFFPVSLITSEIRRLQGHSTVSNLSSGALSWVQRVLTGPTIFGLGPGSPFLLAHKVTHFTPFVDKIVLNGPRTSLCSNPTSFKSSAAVWKLEAQMQVHSSPEQIFWKIDIALDYRADFRISQTLHDSIVTNDMGYNKETECPTEDSVVTLRGDGGNLLRIPLRSFVTQQESGPCAWKLISVEFSNMIVIPMNAKFLGNFSVTLFPAQGPRDTDHVAICELAKQEQSIRPH